MDNFEPTQQILHVAGQFSGENLMGHSVSNKIAVPDYRVHSDSIWVPSEFGQSLGYFGRSGMDSGQWTNDDQTGRYTASPNVQPEDESEEIGMTCNVCGDKALGYNFGVITCESCKAFFRRNALKNQHLICPSGGTCEITVTSRRCCQQCRLQKCFQVGMKSELIITGAQLAEKRRKRRMRSCAAPSPQRNVKTPNVFSDISDADNNSGRVKMGAKVQKWKKCTINDKQIERINNAPPQPIQQRNNVQIDETALQLALEHSREIEISPETLSALTTATEDDLVDITIRVPRSSLASLLFSNTRRAVGNVLVRPKAQTHRIGHSEMGRKSVEEEDDAGNARMTDQMENVMSEQVLGNNAEMPELAERGENSDNLTVATVPTNIQYQPVDNPNYSTTANTSISLTDTDEIDDLVLSLDMDWQPPLFTPRSLYLSLKLAALDELVQACMEWKGTSRPMPILPNWKADCYSKEDWTNLMYTKALSSINQLKQLSMMKRFSVEDRYSLIRGEWTFSTSYIYTYSPCISAGAREMCFIRAQAGYDPRTDTVNLSPYMKEDFYLELSINKRIKGNVYEEHRAMLGSFPDQWRTDEKLTLIMLAVSLLNPNRVGLIDTTAVARERDIYLELLRDYLESAYGEEDMEENYHYLVKRINWLGEWMKRYCVRTVMEIDLHTLEITYFQIYDFE